MLLTSGCQLMVLEGGQRKNLKSYYTFFSLIKLHRWKIFAFDSICELTDYLTLTDTLWQLYFGFTR